MSGARRTSGKAGRTVLILGRGELRRSLVALGILSVLSAALSLYLSRESFFTKDELGFFVLDGAYGIGTYLDPFIGHLIVLPRLAYGLVFRVLGPDYLPIRLLAALSIVGLGWAVFAYAVQRVRPYAALALAAVILFFGADPLHFLYGHALVVLPSVALGIGAMALLYSPSAKRDIWACILLVAAILCYSQALPFLFGAAALIALRPGWRRRSWVILVPTAIYGLWRLWSLQADATSLGQTDADLTTFLSLPSVMFALLGFGLDGITGLRFESGWSAPDPGPVLAVGLLILIAAAIVKYGWKPLLPSLAALLTMTALVSIVLADYQPQNAISETLPRVDRYLLPLGAALLIVVADLLRPVDGGRATMIPLWTLTAVSVMGSILALQGATRIGSGVATLALAGPPESARGLTNALVQDMLAWSPGGRAEARSAQPLDGKALATAIEKFGRPQVNYNWLGGLIPGQRRWLDEQVAKYLEVETEPVREVTDPRDCRTIEAPSKGLLKTPLPRGGAVLRITNGSGPLRVSRIGEGPGAAVGSARSGGALLLRVPDDGAPPDVFWTLRADADAVEVCRIPRRLALATETGVASR